MRIQHNISALNTHRNLNFNNTNANKALEKLSSGYKINRAGDDAAGLAISEKMRSQIRGLDMAAKNAQDGISLIQTAEGAMNEVHAMLQRGRELAVQAANDTNVNDDRDALQKEIAQISQEIDRIGETTEFNTRKILQGTGVKSGNFDRAAFMDELKTKVLEASEVAVQAAYAGIGFTSSAKVNVKIVNEGPGGYAAYVGTKTPNNLELVIDEYDFSIMNEAQQHEVLVHEMVHLAMRSEGIGVGKDVPAWFMEGTAEFVAGTSGHFNSTTSAARFSTIISALDGSTGRLSGDFYAASSAAVVFMNHQLKGDADSDFKGVMNDLKTMSLDDALKNTAKYKTTGQAGFLADLNANGATTLSSGATIDWTIAPTSYPLGGLAPVDATTNLLFDYNFESSDAGSLKFQIGANEGQTMDIDLPSVSSSNLGLTFVDISTQGGASSAITTFDTAIKSISEQRSLLGAYQNRLEHTINNLGAASENLTAAESRIRDTDMAKEMMNFTKQNILMQAAQSMLAQANQQPQGVLQLLG